MYIQKADGSVTSVADGTALQHGWVQISEDEARQAHPALTGDDIGVEVHHVDQAPGLRTIPTTPSLDNPGGQIDPRIIEATPSEPNS